MSNSFLCIVHRPVVTVDLRNHGDSPHAPDMTKQSMAADVGALIEAAGYAEDGAHVIGHSLGGGVGMALALAHPRLVRSLIVVDSAPTERYLKRLDEPDFSTAHVPTLLSGVDLARFNRAQRNSLSDSRREIDAALKPIIPEAAVRAFLLTSLQLRDRAGGDGNEKELVWKFNLPVIATQMREIFRFPVHEMRGRSFDRPTLFVDGSLSNYVVPALDGQLIFSFFPRAKLRTVQGAGHW